MKNAVFVLLTAIALLSSCSNKKLENNIKSLEKRVAELERKVGPSTTVPAVESSSASTQAQTGLMPAITFQQTDFDFGTVNEGDIVEHVFLFKNTGQGPLIIQNATATCGCTVPQWPRDPIPVGGDGEIKVKFDSKNRQNLQTKYVTITANTKPEQVRLKISGRVLPKDNNSDS